MTGKDLSSSITLTRFKWTATYELPGGEHKRIENVAQCTSSEQCLALVQRIIKKIGGPKAEQKTIIVEPLDHYVFRPRTEIPAILLPLPTFPLDKVKTKEEVEEVNKKFTSLLCFTEITTKREETGVHPFYKALPKDVA